MCSMIWPQRVVRIIYYLTSDLFFIFTWDLYMVIWCKHLETLFQASLLEFVLLLSVQKATAVSPKPTSCPLGHVGQLWARCNLVITAHCIMCSRESWWEIIWSWSGAVIATLPWSLAAQPYRAAWPCNLTVQPYRSASLWHLGSLRNTTTGQTNRSRCMDFNQWGWRKSHLEVMNK